MNLTVFFFYTISDISAVSSGYFYVVNNLSCFPDFYKVPTNQFRSWGVVAIETVLLQLLEVLIVLDEAH